MPRRVAATSCSTCLASIRSWSTPPASLWSSPRRGAAVDPAVASGRLRSAPRAGSRAGRHPGGIVATADHGPTRLAYGAARDLVIGATLVRADGVVATSGGKVVKNVAGYDLGKLLTGSYGTLAVLTRLAFRLHPLPAARRWVTLQQADPDRLHAATQALIHSTIVPAAIEVTRRGSGPSAEGALSVMVQGVEAGAQGCAASAVDLLGPGAQVSALSPAWWVASPEEPGALLIKLTFEISRVNAAVRAVDEAALSAGLVVDMRASTGVGVARITAQSESADPQASALFVAALRDRASSYGGAAVLLDGPATTTSAIDPWGPVRGLEIMRAVKDRFDPGALLAPGRFVGGI